MEFPRYFDEVFNLFYSLTGHEGLDYLLGTFVLALVAVVVGEFTISLVFRFNRKHLDDLNHRMSAMSLLSKDALNAGDITSYHACNKQANDAYGRVFFNMFGLSAASLWPACFALAWMQERFIDVPLPIPFTGLEANYVVVFLVCYIGARIFFGRVKRHLPYFKGMHRMLSSYGQPSRAGI